MRMEKENAFDSLNYIKQIIEDTKKTTVDNGKGFIIWGILISLGLILTYVSIKINLYSYNLYIWIVLIGFGWAYTIFDNLTNKKKKSVRTYTDKVVCSVWTSLGIVMTIMGFIATSVGAIQGVFLTAFMSLQVGTGFFITATIFKQFYMYVIAIIWWIGAIIMMIFPGLYVLPLMGSMMFFFQVVPGIYIYRKYKSQLMGN